MLFLLNSCYLLRFHWFHWDSERKRVGVATFPQQKKKLEVMFSFLSNKILLSGWVLCCSQHQSKVNHSRFMFTILQYRYHIVCLQEITFYLLDLLAGERWWLGWLDWAELYRIGKERISLVCRRTHRRVMWRKEAPENIEGAIYKWKIERGSKIIFKLVRISEMPT